MNITFTDKDVENAGKFANFNFSVNVLKILMKKAPHLTSHLTYTDRIATNKDFYIPDSLSNKCRVLNIHISKKLCEKLSCTKTTMTGVCTPSSDVEIYYVGDDGYGVQCQPSCFNTSYKKNYNTDGVRSVDTPQLAWFNNQCLIVNDAITTYLEKPYFRSNVHYERRINDMPTGFSRVSDDDPLGIGFTYRNNKAYCEYYNRTLDANGECSYTFWEEVTDAVIGMSLVNAAKEVYKIAVNGEQRLDIPEYIRPPPSVNRILKLDNWRSDIDSSFVIPKTISFDKTYQRDKSKIAKTAYTKDNTNRVGRSIGDTANEKLKELLKILKDIAQGLVTAVRDPKFWESVGISISVDVSLAVVQKFCKQIINVLENKLTQKLFIVIIEHGFGNIVLKNTIRSILKTSHACRYTLVEQSCIVIGKNYNRCGLSCWYYNINRCST